MSDDAVDDVPFDALCLECSEFVTVPFRVVRGAGGGFINCAACKNNHPTCRYCKAEKSGNKKKIKLDAVIAVEAAAWAREYYDGEFDAENCERHRAQFGYLARAALGLHFNPAEAMDRVRGFKP